MSKIIDEIKKISKENEYDIEKFESVYDLVAELEEEKEDAIKKNIDYEKQNKQKKEDDEKNKKELEDLKTENEKQKKEILDLKEKYIDRFNEAPKEKNGNNGNNSNISINDLFKEE